VEPELTIDELDLLLDMAQIKLTNTIYMARHKETAGGAALHPDELKRIEGTRDQWQSIVNKLGVWTAARLEGK
jgi:hypothetical protein